MSRRQKRELSLWLGVFTITAIFQFLRASQLDGIIFLVIIALLTYSAFSDRGFTTLGSRPEFRRWGAIYLALIAVVLAFSRIHTLPALVALLLTVPLLLISREKVEHPIHARGAMVKSTLLWSLVAVAAAFWELVSYVIGATSGNDKSTPTISMLVDPMLHHSEGRIFFVILWIFVGYELLFARKS